MIPLGLWLRVWALGFLLLALFFGGVVLVTPSMGLKTCDSTGWQNVVSNGCRRSVNISSSLIPKHPEPKR